MDKRVKEIADYYGRDRELIKLCEECGELTTAAAKFLVAPNDVVRNAISDNLVSELADVFVVCEHIKYLLGLEDRVQHVIDYKLGRQIRRIEQDCLVNGD